MVLNDLILPVRKLSNELNNFATSGYNYAKNNKAGKILYILRFLQTYFFLIKFCVT